MPEESMRLFKARVSKIMFCLILALASFGTPMRAEQIEDLMASMNRPVIAHVLREEAESGGDPPP